MFVVMRLYWPKTEAPSILPLGQGTWAPPGIVPVSNARAAGRDPLRRQIAGDGDPHRRALWRRPFFQGPRGWPYWNLLEYPKPIQNPNLWPDTQSTYFLSRFAMPAGSTLTLRGPFPRARYFKLALYKAAGRHVRLDRRGARRPGHRP